MYPNSFNQIRTTQHFLSWKISPFVNHLSISAFQSGLGPQSGLGLCTVMLKYLLKLT